MSQAEIAQGIRRSRLMGKAGPNAGVSLRLTHPNVYRALSTFACCTLALGLNFLILTPAFDPLGVPKALSGWVFVVIAVAQLITLNRSGDLRLLRLATAFSVGTMFSYGAIAAVSFVQLHQTSLQLPILYFGTAISEFWLLVEPFTNPVTQRTTNGDGGNGNGNGHGDK